MVKFKVDFQFCPIVVSGFEVVNQLGVIGESMAVTAKSVFDNLLDEYGNIVRELEILLTKLSDTTKKADKNLGDYEINNERLMNFNEKLDAQLENIFQELRDLEKQVKNLNVPKVDKALFSEDIAQPSTTIEHLEKIDKDLSVWRKIVEENYKGKLADEIMNIPYSVSDDITFLEDAVDGKQNADCLNEFHKQLKVVFKELATLLDFTEIAAEMEKLKNISNKNREAAERILNDTELFLNKEKNLNKTHSIAKETVKLAEEINALKEKIELLRPKYSPESESIDLEELNYLLEKLQTFDREEMELDIEKVEKEIEEYLEDIDCFTEYIDNCHIKKASDNLTLPACIKKFVNANSQLWSKITISYLNWFTKIRRNGQPFSSKQPYASSSGPKSYGSSPISQSSTIFSCPTTPIPKWSYRTSHPSTLP
ncbi:hypothetical protein JTB14_009148 [Gonioctena quinquepunctata]|nr:hypothetical protein JTB14_009148 [Gonioctena quinquepunctata]